MSYQMLVGIHVTDDEVYTKYRTGMTPLLKNCGGDFLYDFKVAEVLKSASDHVINRTFVLSFPDKQTKEKFFADPNYLKVRSQFFDVSVGKRTIIAEYTVP